MDFKSLFGRMKQEKTNQTSESAELTTVLQDNLDYIKQRLGTPLDLVVRQFDIRQADVSCGVMYFDGLVDSDMIQTDLIRMIQAAQLDETLQKDHQAMFDYLKKEVIATGDIKQGNTMDDVINAITSGLAIFFLDGVKQALLIDVRQWPTRAIEEPSSETVIRGPRDGFIESLQTNITHLRRYIQSASLQFASYKIGKRSKKDLVVAYIDDVVHPDILKEVKRRIETIDMDDAPDTGYIEQWIEDSSLSLFPQTTSTERPDSASAALLQGKVAILLDGTPFVLIVPSTLSNAMQAPSDYYERWTIGSLIRALRYLAGFIAVFLPGLYIALSSYHQGLIPTQLAMSIAASREGVPFPAFIEAIMMVLTMELLREGGARLPQNIGQTIGIVGGLVIGESAVQAGIVSPIMVIVVALNAIASFSIPSYSTAITFRILAFLVMFAAGLFGLFGVILAYIMINIHIVNLKSVGVPYSVPFAPLFVKDFNDVILRMPIPLIDKRPVYMQTKDNTSADRGGKQS